MERNELGAVFLITNGANIHEAPRGDGPISGLSLVHSFYTNFN